MGDHEERYSDEEELGSEEIIDEIIYTPKTFEEMYEMYNQGHVIEREEPEPVSEGPPSDADQDLLSETDPFSYEENVVAERLDVQIKPTSDPIDPIIEVEVIQPQETINVVSDASYTNTSEQSDVLPKPLEPEYPPESELFEDEIPEPNSEGEYDDDIDDLEYTDEESIEEEESLGDEVKIRVFDVLSLF